MPPVAINRSPACAGAPNTTVTLAVDPIKVTSARRTRVYDVGALGVTGGEATEGAPVPTLFVAVTTNVYAVPLVKPPTTADVAPEIVAVAPPGLAVTVYDVIGLPPVEAGATHDTVADVLPATAVTDVGAPGTVGALGVTGAEGADGAPVPTLFAAVTTNVYAVPLVKPPTTADVAPEFVAVAPPGVAVTVYDVMGEPPLFAGEPPRDRRRRVTRNRSHRRRRTRNRRCTRRHRRRRSRRRARTDSVRGRHHKRVRSAIGQATDNRRSRTRNRGRRTARASCHCVRREGRSPVEAGAAHDTVAAPFPATAVTAVGAPGTVGADARSRNIPAMYAPEGDRPDVVIAGAVVPADWK